MSDNDNGGNTAPQMEGDRKYFRSEMTFPYADLESAVDLAQTLHTKAGTAAELDELAVWMNQTASGGTFRTRVGAARMFGLVETTQGRATLTQLGRDALDKSGSERAARVTAFLNVELFRALYEQNKGNPLPPPPAIERQIGGLGISPKQLERSRQTFTKSAIYAGFIDATSGRFVKPGIPDQPSGSKDKADDQSTRNGDGGGPDDPLIKALIQKLPSQGPWSADDRITWFKMMAMAFQMTYGQEPEIQIKKEAAN